MDKIISFESLSDERKAVLRDVEPSIIVEHGEQTRAAVQKVSDYLYALPLSRDQNRKMIGLMHDMLLTAEKEAYEQGIKYYNDLLLHAMEE